MDPKFKFGDNVEYTKKNGEIIKGTACRSFPISFLGSITFIVTIAVRGKNGVGFISRIQEEVRFQDAK